MMKAPGNRSNSRSTRPDSLRHNEISALPVTVTTARPAAHAEQLTEAALLAFIEALVERLGGISELLEACSAHGHGIGALAQPRDGIRPGLPRIVIAAPRLAAGGHAVGAFLGQIADRGLDRGPVLLLLGGELQPSLEAGDASIGECGHVLSVRPQAALFARRGLLRQRKSCARECESDCCSSDCFLHDGHLLDGVV